MLPWPSCVWQRSVAAECRPNTLTTGAPLPCVIIDSSRYMYRVTLCTCLHNRQEVTYTEACDE